MSHLTGKRVAILASNGFEESELLEPLRALRGHGAQVEVVSDDLPAFCARLVEEIGEGRHRGQERSA